METIGILDWGIGGLDLHNKLAKNGYKTIYFSDAGYTPYGKVKATELKLRIEKCCLFLRDKGATKIAIACNAASTVLIAQKNVKGVIEFGIQSIKKLPTQTKIGIIGGKRTIESNVYPNSLNQYKITQNIAQKLSAYIEKGETNSDSFYKDLSEIIKPFNNIDTLVLACTHYPSISKIIEEQFTHKIKLINPANEMFDWIINNWKNANEEQQWFTTGCEKELVIKGQKAFSTKFKEKVVKLNLLDFTAENEYLHKQ